MGGGKGGDRILVRMNYELDDESYQMLQLSDGYMGRMCGLLDELITPLQPYFAPRLWDSLVLGVLGATCKRLEQSLRKVSIPDRCSIKSNHDAQRLRCLFVTPLSATLPLLVQFVWIRTCATF
jgi:hypothetical protein